MWFHRGMMNENIQSAEIILHLFDDVLRSQFLGDIFDVGFCPSAFFANLIHHFFHVDR